jgi:predicted RNA-binding protein YlqC (UPF0109 family)
MIKQLLEHIVKSLVEHPQSVYITELQRDELFVIEIRVLSSDLARVIGSEGRTFRAMRTLVELLGPQGAKDLVVDVAAGPESRS